MGRIVLCLLLSAFVAGPAVAAPITFFFDSGSAAVSVTRTGDNSLVTSFTTALNGVFVVFDPATGTLDDFSISVPTSAPIAMLQVWGGFDTFTIESAGIDPGATYSSIFSSMTGPTSYSFLAGPVDVSGVYGASLSTGPPPGPVTGIPVPFVGTSLLSGSIDTDSMTLELLGLTLAQIPGIGFGETDDLVVKADLNWVGLVPEPTTGALLAFGLTALAAVRRKRTG